MSICPFYTREGEKSIHCGSGDFVKFFNSSEKDKFYEKYCAKTFEKCTLCKKIAAEKSVRLKCMRSTPEKDCIPSSECDEPFEDSPMDDFIKRVSDELTTRKMTYKSIAEKAGITTKRFKAFQEKNYIDPVNWLVTARLISDALGIKPPDAAEIACL